MLKTFLYLPEELNKKIEQAAEEQGKSKAEVLRIAIKEGLGTTTFQSNASAQSMLRIEEIGQKNNIFGPKDASTEIDKYLWDKDWSKDE